MPSASTRSGVYAIVELRTGRSYIGSSAYIHQRWADHRRLLKRGKHHSAFLQNTWDKYGCDAFEFRVLEECAPDRNTLLTLEQQYLDAFHPVFNTCLIAGSRLGVLSPRPDITHCPQGHEYTRKNTYLTKRNQRVCLRCAADKSMAKYTPKTPFTLDGPVCQKGHEWTPDNTRILKNGTRRCIACAAERQRTKNERTRERYRSDPELRASRRADYEQHREERMAKTRERGHKVSAAHRAERLAAGTFRKSDTCRKGHPWTPENTVQWKDKRLCRICRDASRAMTSEEHAAYRARRNERDRAGWHEANQRAYQRRVARLKAVT